MKSPETPAVQTSESEPRKLSRNGLTIAKRGPRADAKYFVRIRFRGKVHEITLAETAKDSFELAVKARREIHAGRWQELKTTTALRENNQTLLSRVFTVYRSFTGPDRPAETTRELNINAITSIVRDVLGADTNVENLSLLRLNAELIWKWKEQKRAAAEAATDDERSQQILRSANSRLRQARSLFSENDDLQTFYRHHKVHFPETLAGFCKEPPFPGCSKDEYHAPSDAIIGKTFAALEQLGKSTDLSDLNLYKACWLAVGFGLRKSEIAAAKNDWFVNIDGTILCRGDVLAKNRKFPEIRVQLGAWQHLRTHIEDKPAADHVLAGNKTERCENTFRRLSHWMRGLGWETTHHIHEFRAWAGCQIAMAAGNDIRTAQIFLRHSSFATTEKFYGHHLKIKLDEVQLTLPTVAKKEFTPVILPDAAQSV